MNKTNICWADYTLNLQVGCKHNCTKETAGFDCYAKQINDRFKMIPNWNEPVWFWERLKDLEKKITIPVKRNPIAQLISPDKPIVFVGSMCDMFGVWNSQEDIDIVMNANVERQDVVFMFLTKNASRYVECLNAVGYFNCIFGSTITNNLQDAPLAFLETISEFEKTFLSIEPIMSDFTGVDFTGIDFIIVGADTSKNPVIPKREWIESINHPRIYYKRNILKYFPDLKNI